MNWAMLWIETVVFLVLFARPKMFRLPGTEHIDKEYAQKRFHVKGMLFPGSLYALILGKL